VLCFQYADHGFVSNSMLLVIVLQATYVLDFFYNEGWYLRTIDIAHDHFGFYLAWGDTVWLPMMYTLQALYLVYNPVVLSTASCVAVLGLGWLGYGIFRAVNDQKDFVRKANGRCSVWGAPARYLEVEYETRQGPRTSLLLLSGFWGLSRHFNYVGDLLLSAAMCLACGTSHLLPYFYVVYLTILLVHRVGRDDARCSAKYGKAWQTYCKLVPWKILPYVY
jgi:7-dehydrocholesterol reductase